ncbi:MAG: hypothetical protein M3417_10495 [Actinomycetota bacterium]|nr:hypothetical protein [Actinomycetota bacterium]
MRTRNMLSALAVATLTLTACGKSESVSQRGDKVVRDWIAAAVNKDGKTYCGLMTPRLLRSTSGRSDGAEKTCERQIKAGAGDYPFQFEIPKPTTNKAGGAEVAASGKKLRGRVTLKQQKGKLLIDAVR